VNGTGSGMRKVARPRILAAVGGLLVLAALVGGGIWVWGVIFGPRAISAGSGPVAVAISPDGRFLYAADEGNCDIDTYRACRYVAIVDTRRGFTSKIVKVDPEPADVAVDGAGDTLYVDYNSYYPDSSDSSQISRVSLPSGRVGEPLNFPGVVDSMEMSPDGTALYVLVQKGNGPIRIFPVDAASGIVGRAVTLPDGIVPLAIAAGDGGEVYLSTGDNGGRNDWIYSFNVRSGSVMGKVRVGYTPTGLEASTDVRDLWIIGDNSECGADASDCEGPRALVEIGLPEMKIVKQVSLGPTPVGVAVDPSGRVVFASCDDGHGHNSVEVIDAASGHVEASLRTGPILGAGGHELGSPMMVLSPDGKTLYTINESGKVAVLSVAGYTGH
jgi:DNA-binding beta-propeller fold protein YncE